ncbi:MAG: ribbon-helix-helix protein, CopG family [Candidatus Korobacteraceae bacterium]
MRNTKTLSITLPPEMLSRAEALAKREDRTMSELIREALRYYERQRWWEETTVFGRSSAAATGIKNEDDVVRAVHEYRGERRRSRKKQSA